MVLAGSPSDGSTMDSPADGSLLAPLFDPQAELLAAFDRHTRNHSHSLGLIQLFLKMVLTGAIGFRGAASAMEVASLLFPTDEQAPSPNGGQMWLLRMGLYELSRPKQQADDWVWIVDHTIQVGRVKCLIVVGVQLKAWEAKRAEQDQSAALAHHDLSVWMIEPVGRSDGVTVHRQLEDLGRQTGIVPCEILSDCGGDLQNGVGRFCAEHPQTTGSKDMAHAAANAVKRELTNDEHWAAFLRDASLAKTKMRQTQFAFLLPPELKAKARWMNLDSLLTWSRKAMDFVVSPRSLPGLSWEADELEEKMGWIRGYQEPLASWSKMLQVTATCLTYIREQGYHPDAKKELQAELVDFTTNTETPEARVAERLLAFVGEQSSAILPGKRLLGSSEVLESLIGKAKQLEGQQSKSGFTKMILGLAASVSEITEKNIHTALSAVKVREVVAWVREKLGISVQAHRHRAFATIPTGTKTG
jgi:hypothetical protein